MKKLKINEILSSISKVSESLLKISEKGKGKILKAKSNHQKHQDG